MALFDPHELMTLRLGSIHFLVPGMLVMPQALDATGS